IGLYDDRAGRLVLRRTVEVDVEGELTEIPELVGETQPDLLLLNDGDLTYAKIRLDERSLATVVDGLSKLDDSLARALVWGATWDMTRDAEMAARDFVTLVLANIGAETDAWGVSRIPTYAAQAVSTFSAPEHRDELRSRWESGLRELVLAAEPGSDAQLTFARSYAAAARSERAVGDVEALLDGGLEIDGLAVDQDLRWSLVTSLAASGNAGERIEAELERDRTISGQEHAAAARAARPTAEAKAEAWEVAMVSTETPNETQRSVAMSFQRSGQDDVLAPYVERYLAAADEVWDRLGNKRASTALEAMFPRQLASQELLDRADAWLERTPAPPAAKRYVAEGRADVARALAAQERDARG
ncbi:MAG: ERAP1-like C-terminal domain-containing protein, partial [Nocardioides sp.]|nr:ERAP1-like C-terminal domain-containing protein [Nocardioides sp.]